METKPRTLGTLKELMSPAIEDDLRGVITQFFEDKPEIEALRHMLAYHMGWEGDGAGPEALGKRIRPWLVLLVAEACEGEWHESLPASAAVEFVHNFSLIHDDIEDDSPLRRGRLTLWKKWGIAKAINAGDTLFTIAHQSIMRLEQTTSPQTVIQAVHLLQEACLKITFGQQMDLASSGNGEIALDSYWQMVGGKTASLISACTGLGALLGGANPKRQLHMRQFGYHLGLAFQVKDDMLGIWGDSHITGKSSTSDLIEGKLSLPVLYGLQNNGRFAERWKHGQIQPEEVPGLASQLEGENARSFAEKEADRLTTISLHELELGLPDHERREPLLNLTLDLLKRKM